ncbi:Williams-Beuren syndrome chromosomal region 27 protein [Cricetulus griseus]|uniref:Williams-Beuren syndrome chromosomal region 27 protein n=1 Tax=Cricetulus griseus TaxID=10029 RepID=G3IIF9_CRIGR|nr:Williams-Beuren syndrome chromosomal region 27 protein [Cricetulus griseus]
MTREEAGRLPQVLARIGASHDITDLACKLRFYDSWAPEYDQDVAALKYKEPCLAVECLSGAPLGPPHDALILDVACGTGLVAVEVRPSDNVKSPHLIHKAGTYRCLRSYYSQWTFDAVIIVGNLREGQVPCSAIPELLRVTKPGGLVCLTTRSNLSNLPYKEVLEATLDSLEQAGAWECLVAKPVEHWELATSEHKTGLGNCANDGFISGIVYLYRKQERGQGH